MLHLITSNRYEILQAKLLAQLAVAPDDPFRPQEVIVPSAAIKRDLQLSMARVYGVAAGLELPFLAQWLWERIAQLVPVDPISPFAPERLTWRLFRLFQSPQLVAVHPRLAGYLAEADPVMTLDLARHLAGLFEQYITYRPDWLAAWSQGEPARLPGAGLRERQDEAWQMALWQRLTADLGTASQHPSVAFFAALERLGPAGVAAAGLPGEAHVFCLSTLPPLYLELLTRLSQWIDIHLYLLNPCREYWFDLVAQKRLARLTAQGKGEYLEARHPLLADWGRQTQALFGLILETVAEVSEEDGIFEPSPEDSLLACFQNSILELQAPAPGEWPLAADDRSIEIHVAHSLTRELEILQDQLLARFAADPELSPAQVLVVTPDLDAAAPLIEAVFGPRGRIPYTITGQRAARSNPVARVLLQILDLAVSRFPASQVFALLQEPLVAEPLGLDETALEQLHEALQEAGVHWGLDAASRQAAGLPADFRHTWRDGLGRLLLGYALPREGGAFAGIVPAANLGGSRARVLGPLWRVLERLEQLASALARPRVAGAWRDLWQGLLAEWLGPPPDPASAEALRDVLLALADLGTAMAEGDVPGSSPGTIPFAAARAALEGAVEAQARGGMPSGNVTFGALSSLRHLPYALVCLVGLNDGAFPRPDKPLEFDLAPLENRPGDRQRRQDERNLFLDLLLAARRGLYLSYTGRSQRDDSPLPPSILVAELLEFLCRATGASPDRFRVRHPLQAFSPTYFDASQRTDSRLVSYDEHYALSLAGAARPQVLPASLSEVGDEDSEEEAAAPALQQPLFFTAALSPEPAGAVPLAQLQAFFRHPGRFLLKDRLGLALPGGEGELVDEEPLLPDGLSRYALASRLLESALRGVVREDLLDQARAGPEFPSGHLGEGALAVEVDGVIDFAADLGPLVLRADQAPLGFHLALPGGTLWGQLSNWGPGGLLRYRCARAAATDYLGAWLDHLCFNALAPEGAERVTTHLARDRCFRLHPVADPGPLLADLLEAWQAGRLAPLPFYPKSAWALATLGPGKARERWTGLRGWPGEGDDPWWALALRGQPDPLGADFQSWVSRLLTPLMAHLDDTELLG